MFSRYRGSRGIISVVCGVGCVAYGLAAEAHLVLLLGAALLVRGAYLLTRSRGRGAGSRPYRTSGR